MITDAPAHHVVGFKRHLRAEIQEGLGAFLFSERGVTALRGAHIEAVAALLDGSNDVETVLAARPGGLAPQQVARLLDQLIASGIVAVYPQQELEADDAALAFWDACDAQAGARRRSATVGLLAVGTSDEGAATRDALEASGLTVTVATTSAPPPGTELSVVLCDDYLNPLLADVDAAHRAAGVPWLLAKPVGTQVWVGPVFEPGAGGCWHCLSHRLWGHRRAEACVQHLLGRIGPADRAQVAVPALTALASNVVSLEAAKWLAGHRYQAQRCVWTLDSVDLCGQRHEFHARPQCPACGDPSLVAAKTREPVVLPPTAKTSVGGSGHRALSPEEVLETYRPLISPVTGVVKEITRDRRGPSFLNAYVSGPNPGIRSDGMATLSTVVRQHSGGKGATARDAEVGALCEALERYSGTCQGDEERVTASMRSLGAAAVHPNDCMLFDRRQYEHRTTWNPNHAPFQRVCAPFDEETEIDWTPVWSLTGQRHRMLPTAMLYYGVPDSPESVSADSNGCAAGSSMADAVLQGLLELIERDAVALWWYNRTTAPGVDLAAFGEPWVDELLRQFAALGRELWVLDITSDFGVPVMVAVSRNTRTRREDISFGFGAHLDPRVALRRALAEHNQLMPAVLGTDPATLDDPDAALWVRHATTANQPYLVPREDESARGPADYELETADDISQDVAMLAARLARNELETLVLDQTRPDIGLPVVRVIVPGLRHYWARFAPGRLYDVPVALGRLAAPTTYLDLNPIPMFL